MATDMERARGGVLEPCRDDESLVIYDCFHALHAGCAHGRDACPRCHTPRRVHDDDDRPGGGGTGDEPRLRRCDGDGESPASISGCNDVASQFGCCACSRRVAELDSSLELKTAALIETTSVLQFELDRVESRLYRLEEMYGKLEQEFIRLRDGRRAREIEDDEERKKPRNGGSSVTSFPQHQTD